jgi:hypothetical protein
VTCNLKVLQLSKSRNFQSILFFEFAAAIVCSWCPSVQPLSSRSCSLSVCGVGGGGEARLAYTWMFKTEADIVLMLAVSGCSTSWGCYCAMQQSTTDCQQHQASLSHVTCVSLALQHVPQPLPQHLKLRPCIRHSRRTHQLLHGATIDTLWLLPILNNSLLL